MMDAWYALVGVDDTIVCLGDVSVDGTVQEHHQEWWHGMMRSTEPSGSCSATTTWTTVNQGGTTRSATGPRITLSRVPAEPPLLG